MWGDGYDVKWKRRMVECRGGLDLFSSGYHRWFMKKKKKKERKNGRRQGWN